MCVGTVKGPAVRSGVCQHHLGPFLVIQPIKGGLLSDMSSPDVLLTNLSICVRERTAGEEETHLSQEVKQECGRGEIGGRGKIPLVFLACNKKMCDV